VVAAAVFLLNTNLLAPARHGTPMLIAHRGLGQPFSRDGLTGDTCTAAQSLPAGHRFIENTLPSIEAAFAAGADAVEFDVQPTTDGHFVIFHDWTLDCRTEGTGQTRAHSLAALKALDVGYGYTSDGGRNFPLRGTGVGLMPTLDEVLDAFPGKRFLVNIKSNDPAEGTALAGALAGRAADDLGRLTIYGRAQPVAAFHAALPAARTLNGDGLIRCLLRYAALGWTSYVPADCRNTLVLVPIDYAPWLWGYPARLLGRLEAAGSMLVLLGAYDGSGFSSGLDDPAELADIPAGFDGAIWTNRIDLIGPALAERMRASQ
jgi:glycerophosphoryl diester phosphodiesterase